MRPIDADELLSHQVEADKMGKLLVVGKGHILDAPTISTLVRDTETGLLPCGCGGKAISKSEYMTDFVTIWWVECEYCEITTSQFNQSDEAIKWWNKAMGWKE